MYNVNCWITISILKFKTNYKLFGGSHILVKLCSCLLNLHLFIADCLVGMIYIQWLFCLFLKGAVSIFFLIISLFSPCDNQIMRKLRYKSSVENTSKEEYYSWTVRSRSWGELKGNENFNVKRNFWWKKELRSWKYKVVYFNSLVELTFINLFVCFRDSLAKLRSHNQAIISISATLSERKNLNIGDPATKVTASYSWYVTFMRLITPRQPDAFQSVAAF